MVDLKEMLEKTSQRIGTDVEMKGLLLKSARLKRPAATRPEDVAGWDIITRDNTGTCYEHYEAQYPLIGMTQPQPIPCPVGLQTFDHYNINFAEAIEMMHQLNCGDSFIQLQLCWPLVHPQLNEPYWYLRTNLGNEIVIGADTGQRDCKSF